MLEDLVNHRVNGQRYQVQPAFPSLTRHHRAVKSTGCCSQSEVVQSNLYLKTTHGLQLVAPSTLIEVWRESLSFLGEVKKNSRHIFKFTFIFDGFVSLGSHTKAMAGCSQGCRIWNCPLQNSREERKRMGKSSGRSDFWDHFGGQALVMIDGWYSRQPLTNLLANPNNPRNR